MKNHQISALCLILTTLFILSACSPVRVAKVEKRRYQNGYYVQMKQKAPKRTAKSKIEDKERGIAGADGEIPGCNSEVTDEPGIEIRRISTAIKTFRNAEHLKMALSSLDHLAENVVTVNTAKNQASVSADQVKANDISDADDKKGGTVGVLLLLIAISFLVMFLLVSWALIVVIAAAVMIGIVLSIILKAVGLIGD